MTQEPKKGDFKELKSKQFPEGVCMPHVPPTSLRLRLGNRSVFIVDPRL